MDLKFDFFFLIKKIPLIIFNTNFLLIYIIKEFVRKTSYIMLRILVLKIFMVAKLNIVVGFSSFTNKIKFI